MNNEKSTFVAYVLFVFFGVFGIHRVYLGRPWTAILFFLTGAFAGLGLLWDLFAIPSYVSEANTCSCC